MPELLTASAVAGLGVAMPERVVTTVEIAARFGVDPDWIVSRTGILERRHAAAGEGTTDLAARAASAALADAGIPAADVDLVLVATCSPDEQVAAAAPQVARAIGAVNAGAIDLGAACTGFVSGLSLAAGALESGRARCVVLIGAEVLSRMIDPEDRRTAALFGDGAGAVVLISPMGIGPVVLGSDGTCAGLLFASRERGVIEMEGQEVFRHAVDRMAQATLDAAAAAGTGLGGIDLFVYHQANARIIRAVGRRLALDPDRVVDVIARHGNTSSASIPLALAEARADGRLVPGARVLLAAFGAGFTWGGTVLAW
jgi:3-oxoacyl-[acyl-carrier-protein] synthase-3